MIKKKITYSVLAMLTILSMQGMTSVQDEPQSTKPQPLKLKALVGENKDKEEVSLEELLPNADFAEPTVLMFVTETDEKTTDENVVKLAKLIDYVVKTYAEKNARGAIIFQGESHAKAKEELVAAELTIPVANYLSGELEGYKIEKSSTAPVTVVMWTKSAIDKKNIKAWSPADLENLDEAGQAMVVQFIGLLE